MSWSENEKFVLDKLESLEKATRENAQERKKEHKELYAYVTETRSELKSDIESLGTEIRETLDTQDQRTEVSRMKVLQAVLVGGVLTLANVVLVLHLNIQLF